MTLEISRRFGDRLIREPALGQLRDGPIRYLTLRPDVLMGMFALMTPSARREALAALARSVAEFGGRSVRAYVDSGAATPQSLMATISETAADLGWGVWRFDPPTPDGAIAVIVHNSPFAQAATPSDIPVCAAIVGMLSAVAPYLVGQGAVVEETVCSAQSGQGACRFMIRV